MWFRSLQTSRWQMLTLLARLLLSAVTCQWQAVKELCCFALLVIYQLPLILKDPRASISEHASCDGKARRRALYSFRTFTPLWSLGVRISSGRLTTSLTRTTSKPDHGTTGLAFETSMSKSSGNWTSSRMLSYSCKSLHPRLSPKWSSGATSGRSSGDLANVSRETQLELFQ